jgi:hypothetical protein
MSRNTDQLELFKEELSKLSRDVPTYGVWKALLHFLIDLKSDQNEINRQVSGNGNGEAGVLERVQNLEAKLQRVEDLAKVTQSDTRETKNMVLTIYRGEVPDKRPTFDKFVNYFVEKILPPLIVTAMAGAFAFWIAVQNHLILAP